MAKRDSDSPAIVFLAAFARTQRNREDHVSQASDVGSIPIARSINPVDAVGLPRPATAAGNCLARFVGRTAASRVSGAACHAGMESTRWQRENSGGEKAVARESTAASPPDSEPSATKRQFASARFGTVVE